MLGSNTSERVSKFLENSAILLIYYLYLIFALIFLDKNFTTWINAL